MQLYEVSQKALALGVLYKDSRLFRVRFML